MKIPFVLLIAGLAIGAQAQTSVYYITDGDNATMNAYTANTQLWAMPLVVSGSEYPIAVYRDIRTLGTNPGLVGGQYDLNGNFIGGTYTNNTNDIFYDSTSSGSSHYLVSWVNNVVYQTDTSYQNPVPLFGLGGDPLGITYDPTNGSLWIADFSGGNVSNYDLAGNLLSSFNSGLGNQAALGLDHADGTLWMIEYVNFTAFQYDKAGNLLGSFFDPNMTPNPLGGEFPIPAPGALALLAIGGLAATRRRRA